jgi:hypothetical protein
MKIVRSHRRLSTAFGIAARFHNLVTYAAPRVATLALTTGALFATSVALTACADENEPQTWVKRLDDPAQRPASIKRLSQFFEDGMTRTNKDRESPEIKSLLDKIAEPMTKQYTAGNLDEKTRKELIKFLADTRDPRTAPALAKAFNEYEAGKNDEDVKFAAQSVNGMATASKLTDQNLIDAVWNCFSKFQVSKAKSINLVKDLHDAVLAVEHPTYGPKAVEKLSAGVDTKNTEQVKDQIQFWQMTSIQIIGELKFAAASKALVGVLLAPAKSDLRATTNSALMKIPKEAEAQLVAALNGFGPEKTHIAILADSVAYISRPAGRDAVLAALGQVDNDSNRVVVAQSLYRFPPDPRILPAFLDAYKKIPPNAHIAMLRGDYGRAALALVSAHFYDPTLVDWLLKEMATANGDEVDALRLSGLEAAIKLMPASRTRAVNDAVAKFGTPREQEMWKAASRVVDKCNADANCYVKTLDEPIPSSPKTANMGAIKASYMAAIYGNAATAKVLASKLDKVKDAGARLALAEAIDHLLPPGDNAVAEMLEKVVDADKAAGNQSVLFADDAVVKVALRLRARALP